MRNSLVVVKTVMEKGSANLAILTKSVVLLHCSPGAAYVVDWATAVIFAVVPMVGATGQGGARCSSHRTKGFRISANLSDDGHDRSGRCMVSSCLSRYRVKGGDAVGREMRRSGLLRGGPHSLSCSGRKMGAKTSNWAAILRRSSRMSGEVFVPFTVN